LGDVKDNHVAIAVDLDDLMDPAAVRARLALLKCLSGRSKEEVASLEKLFAGIKGLRIVAKIGETTRTSLYLDFADEIGSAAELLKPCIDEIVAMAGATIPEFEKATWKVTGKSATVQANLSDGSLARLMTMALMPMHATEAAPVGSTSEEFQLIATRRYYRAIVVL